MFRKIRRADRALNEDETKAILKRGSYAVLSTWGEDGYPYGVPVNYAYSGNQIFFHGTMAPGHKNNNLQYCKNVCLTVVDRADLLTDKFSVDYASAIVFGKVRALEGEEKKTAFRTFIERFEADFLELGYQKVENGVQTTGIFVVDIEYITGKARK